VDSSLLYEEVEFTNMRNGIHRNSWDAGEFFVKTADRKCSVIVVLENGLFVPIQAK